MIDSPLAAGLPVVTAPFRPRARLLQLLGDELIGSARLAVFELVKNAYDADATNVEVRMVVNPHSPKTITITDDGHGMTLDTIRAVWLVPGDDHRREQRWKRKRTPKHGRLPTGEKGLGRFAAHKLGDKIELTTRASHEHECVVAIDWRRLADHRFLDEVPVTIHTRPPEVFPGTSTGTRITISNLRTAWKDGDIRRLYRQLTSISSPFKQKADGFHVQFVVPDRQHILADLPDVDDILRRAIWTFDFSFANGVFEWIYEFRQIPGFGVAPRTIESDADSQLLLPKERGRKVVATAEMCSGIGPVNGEFHVYDRDKAILRRWPEIQFVTKYLNENGGIRIYRDGIRVYNYGESDDNWLGLDLRRVNIPTLRISRNIVLGAISLSLKDSTGLVEKTNREGFVENDALDRLRSIVLGALSTFELERRRDKERIRAEATGLVESRTSKVTHAFAKLQDQLDQNEHLGEIRSQLTSIQRGYETMQEVLTRTGMSGLNLALVFHEVERGVRGLYDQIVGGTNVDQVAAQARELIKLLDGFSGLLRRGRKHAHSLRKVAATAKHINSLRIARHGVVLTCPFLDEDGDDQMATLFFSLVVGALNNLIDNAIYWLNVRWPDESVGKRKLYIDLSHDFDFGPALVVADSGIGFQGDDPVEVTRPFYTRRPTGMGLGLYYAHLAMELSGGQLVFPQPGEIAVPDEYDGAIVALLFKGP